MVDTLTPEQRQRCMTAVKGKDTTPEMVVRRLVHGLGYRYRLHVRGLPGTPDLVFVSRWKVINVHGCFWHMHQAKGCGRCRIPATRRAYWKAKLERNRLRDQRAERALRRMGYSVLTVWECQTTAGKLGPLRRRVERFLG